MFQLQCGKKSVSQGQEESQLVKAPALWLKQEYRDEEEGAGNPWLSQTESYQFLYGLLFFFYILFYIRVD